MLADGAVARLLRFYQRSGLSGLLPVASRPKDARSSAKIVAAQLLGPVGKHRHAGRGNALVSCHRSGHPIIEVFEKRVVLSARVCEA